jgi:TolB-like protein/Flp pilus assembly protein TadD
MVECGPHTLNATSRAAFISYASQDAEAAGRICEALRTAGVEVWFDQSELRGGDAWDRRIREQIHACRLFIPVISAHSEERDEGYFRREWKLAVDRTHDMAENKAFIMPVVIDGTTERRASVPDKFHELQWTRLPGGDTTPVFIDLVRRLLPGSDAKSAAPRETPAGLVSAPQAAAGVRVGASRRESRRAVLLGAAAIALLAVGSLALYRFGLRPRAAPAEVGSSIAVLPLVNESGDANQQYFSDGITEDLITALSQIPELKVVGRASAFRFRDSKEDSRSIGTQLGVSHLLEGSVRRSGDIVRVSTELINAADGTTQWSDRYDRPYKDLFALQDEITRAVAGALKAKLLTSGSGKAESDRPPSGKLEAYTALLQGRFYAQRSSEAGFRQAIDQFSIATQLDPDYALAWSDLARVLDGLAENYLGGSAAQQTYSRAQAAAQRALALAPGLAAAHVAQGYLLQRAGFDPRAARAEFDRAVQLAPEDLEARFGLGNQLASVGQVERAVELTREVLATDPMNSRRLNWMAIYLGGLGRLDEAERAARKAIELSPDSDSFAATLAGIAVQRGDARAAATVAERSPPGTWRTIALARAYQIGSDRAAADAALKTLIDTQGDESAFQVAEVYALRNEADKTFEWLEHAWTTRDPGITGLLYDPFVARYRADPRFATFCRKVGLPIPGET